MVTIPAALLWMLVNPVMAAKRVDGHQGENGKSKYVALCGYIVWRVDNLPAASTLHRSSLYYPYLFSRGGSIAAIHTTRPKGMLATRRRSNSNSAGELESWGVAQAGRRQALGVAARCNGTASAINLARSSGSDSRTSWPVERYV